MEFSVGSTMSFNWTARCRRCRWQDFLPMDQWRNISRLVWLQRLQNRIRGMAVPLGYIFQQTLHIMSHLPMMLQIWQLARLQHHCIARIFNIDFLFLIQELHHLVSLTILQTQQQCFCSFLEFRCHRLQSSVKLKLVLPFGTYCSIVAT